MAIFSCDCCGEEKQKTFYCSDKCRKRFQKYGASKKGDSALAENTSKTDAIISVLAEKDQIIQDLQEENRQLKQNSNRNAFGEHRNFQGQPNPDYDPNRGYREPAVSL